MIDPSLFTVEGLLNTMLDTSFGNVNKWWALCEIIPAYKAPYAKEGDPSRCVVRCKNPNGDNRCHFLRFSKGPWQGHIWDMYGDDYQTAEIALMALLTAPIPPGFIDQDVWRAASAAEALNNVHR